MLRLLTAAYGTGRLCPDVRDQGESWRVSGPIPAIGNPMRRARSATRTTVAAAGGIGNRPHSAFAFRPSRKYMGLNESGDRLCGVGAVAVGALTARNETTVRPLQPLWKS